MKSDKMTISEFAEATSTCASVVDSAINGHLRVPDFKGIADIIKRVYETVEPNKGTNNH